VVAVIAAGITILLALAALAWQHSYWRGRLEREQEGFEYEIEVLTEERDALVLLCESERERAQIAECALYGHFVDCRDVVPIAAARAARCAMSGIRIPDPAEFFDAALKNALAVVGLAMTTAGLELSESDRKTAEAGAATGITAAVDELRRRGLLTVAGQ
jgi:hypothetical protein